MTLRQTPSHVTRLTGIRGIGFLLALLFVPTACSFLVDKKTAQCQSNADCARFSQTVCDEKEQVCIALTTDAGTSHTVDVGDPCQGPAGCYACQPANENQVLASCTDSTCIPFDNGRLTNLNSDGTLKPLP